MKFTLSKNELSKLSTLVKTSQTVSDVSIKASHYMFKLADKLYASIYGSGNVVDFSVEVTDVELSGNGYFNVDVTQLIQAFEKVYMASGADVATADVQANKIIVSNGKSRISVNLFDLLDEADFTEAFAALPSKKTEKFASNTVAATITPDVVSFMETVGKFINMVGNDRVSAKLAGTYNVTYSEDGQYMLIEVPQIGFNAIITVPETLCEYPEEEVLKQICPDETNMVEFDVDIPTLLTKMNMFDGVFPSSQWRWKTIEFYNKNEDGEKSMNMRYSNMCAEVDTDLPVMNLNEVGTIPEFSFRLASILVYDYLNKLVGGARTAHVKVSPLEADQPNGVGVIFDVDNFRLVTSKMVNEDSI